MNKTQKLIELFKQGHTHKTVDKTIASRSFIWNVYQRYKKGEFSREQAGIMPKGERAATPSLKLKIAATPTDKEKLKIIQPGTPGQELPTPTMLDFTAEECAYIFELINQIIPEKRRPSDKSTTILGKLWLKPINKLIEQYSDKNPLLVIAVIITGGIYLPVIIGVIADWRMEKEKEKKQKRLKPKEDSKND